MSQIQIFASTYVTSLSYCICLCHIAQALSQTWLWYLPQAQAVSSVYMIGLPIPSGYCIYQDIIPDDAMADIINSSYGICLCHHPSLSHLSSHRPGLMYLPCHKPRLRYMPCHKSRSMRLSMSEAQTMASVYVISSECGICLCYRPRLLHLSMSKTKLYHLRRNKSSLLLQAMS